MHFGTKRDANYGTHSKYLWLNGTHSNKHCVSFITAIDETLHPMAIAETPLLVVIDDILHHVAIDEIRILWQ